MKTPVELVVSGMQTLHLQHRCRAGYRVKARPSYVDESLFGQPKPGTRALLPPTMTRPSCASKGLVGAKGAHHPSRDSTPEPSPTRERDRYLVTGVGGDSLFGSRSEGASFKAPRMAKGDAAKLRALFWTPPATPRGSHSPRPREAPLRAIHPAGPSKTEPRVAADSQKLSMDGLRSSHPLRRGRSRSLTHLNLPSTGHPATSAPHTNRPQDPRPSTSGVTFQSPLVTSRARSVSISVPATPRQGGATQKPKPPWK
uniref:RBPJ-interacting and tubulin-associated protein 1 n=1 Tax=Aotus nancymaae TaxID=37293 RepID=A0A2K5C5W6_AOTNA